MFCQEIICLGLTKILSLFFDVCWYILDSALLFNCLGMFSYCVSLSLMLIVEGFSLELCILGGGCQLIYLVTILRNLDSIDGYQISGR